MISVTQLRSGVCFMDQGQPWRVVSYKHTHMSRGSGTIKVKCRNLQSGNMLNKTYKSGERVEEIEVYKKPYQYLYREGDDYVFMDQESFEQLTVSKTVLGEDSVYLVEGGQVEILFWDEKALGLDLPPKMEFTVAEAAPGEKGDSASNVYKDAVLANGLKVRVPLFIYEGDKVRVDTRDGSYVERVSR